MASSLSSNPAMGGNLSEEAHMTDEFKQYKEKRPWPVQRRKLQVFSEDPTLSKLRKFTSKCYQRKEVSINSVDSTKNRKKCGLCTKGNFKYRQTSYMCNTRDVPLCVCQYGRHGTQYDCFQLWHKAENLIEAHEKTNDSIARRSPAEEVGGDENDNLSTYSVGGNMMSFEVETVPILPPILHQVDMPAQSQANDNRTFVHEGGVELKGCEVIIHIIFIINR
jgi:hypothetical protein